MEIVGVSLDNDTSEWTSAIKKWGMLWPQISDLKGWKSQVIELYAIGTIPCLILIDQDGTIVARNIKAKMLGDELKKYFRE